MKYVIGSLQWKLPRAPVPFNPALWLRALMQSDCLHSSLFFEHYNRILLCEWMIELCCIRLIDGVSCHNAFAFYIDSTNQGIGALHRSSVETSVTF